MQDCDERAKGSDTSGLGKVEAWECCLWASHVGNGLGYCFGQKEKLTMLCIESFAWSVMARYVACGYLWSTYLIVFLHDRCKRERRWSGARLAYPINAETQQIIPYSIPYATTSI